MSAQVAALFVETNGIYYGRDDADPWDVTRDARKYAGPLPVVSHPPCERWCRMAPLVQKTHGYRVGDDGGCFESALAAVRKWGGVLEHPEASYAWRAHGLTTPPREGGWVKADNVGGWTCRVEQGHYGHRARKATWLYACGVELPAMVWGKSTATAYVTDGGGGVKRGRDGDVDPSRKRLSQREASSTPPAFAEILLGMAKTHRSL